MTSQTNPERGGNLVEDEDGSIWPWPFCISEGCPNRVCLGISAVRCYVCLSPEQRRRKDEQLKIEASELGGTA